MYPPNFSLTPISRSNGVQSHMTCVGTPSGHPDQDESQSVNVCSSSGQSTAGLSMLFVLTHISRSKVKRTSKSHDMCGHTQCSSWPRKVRIGKCMKQRWPIYCKVNNVNHTSAHPSAPPLRTSTYGAHFMVPSLTRWAGTKRGKVIKGLASLTFWVLKFTTQRS